MTGSYYECLKEWNHHTRQSSSNEALLEEHGSSSREKGEVARYAVLGFQ